MAKTRNQLRDRSFRASFLSLSGDIGMSGGVFICYRREEFAFAARAIYDRVAQRVGRENVFLDVDSIDLGVDWFDALNERVAACDALVAVIGRNWVAADKDNGGGASTIPMILFESRSRLCSSAGFA